METDKLKEEIANGINTLLGAVKPTDLKRWVATNERQPTDYILAILPFIFGMWIRKNGVVKLNIGWRMLGRFYCT